MQEQLRQKLIDEPLLEYQEQYNEDPVQPTTREDALALTDLLANSLPLGSIQVGCMHNLLAVVGNAMLKSDKVLCPGLRSFLLFCLIVWVKIQT